MATSPFSFKVEESKDRLLLGDIFSVSQSTPKMTAVGTLDVIRRAGEKAGETIGGTGEETSPVKRGLTALFEGRGGKEALKEAGRGIKPLTTEQLIQTAIGTVSPLKAVGPDALLKTYAQRISRTATKEIVPFGQRLSDLYTAVVDRFNPIVRLVRKAETSIPSGQNPELLARTYLGNVMRTEQKLFSNTYSIEKDGTILNTGPALQEILGPMNKNLDDLDILLTAQRDLELAKRGELRRTKFEIIGTTPRESMEAINALRQKYGSGFKALEETVVKTRDWTKRAFLDPLLEVGALSQGQYNAIRSANEFYTPFRRVIEELETNGFVPRNAKLFSPSPFPIQEIKGSTRQIISPLESLVTNTYKISDFVEKTRVVNSIANLRNFSKDLSEIIIPIEKPSQVFNKNVITTFENGGRKYFQVPTDVAKLVNNISGSDMNMVVKILGFPARVLRAGATLSLEFIGRNPIRDQFSAFVYSKYGYRPGIDLVSGMWSLIHRDDLYQRWLTSGGAHSMFVSLDRISSQKTLQEVAGNVSFANKVVRYRNPLEALRVLSEFGEKGTRIGESKRAIAGGATDIEAGFVSREVTLDFSRIGQQTKFLNQIIAFWNANVQGLDKLVRSLKEAPMRTSLKAVGGITLPSIGLYLLQKDNPRYKELPQWRKDLFWNIVVTNGPIISIPKPFELGIIFGTVPEHILKWTEENDPDAFQKVVSALGRGSAPGIIPTILTPYIENKTNYSFFRDRPIVGQSIEGLPKELQANTYTSQTAREIGKLLKTSPAQIENWVYGYAAGMGRYALEISDEILKKTGIVVPPPEPTGKLADIPGLRAFVSREPIGPGSESVNRFFDLLEEARRNKDGVTFLAKQGREEEAIKFYQDHLEADYAKGLEKVAKDFSEMRQTVDAVLQSRTMDPKEKRTAIDSINALMTEEARQVLELIGSSRR